MPLILTSKAAATKVAASKTAAAKSASSKAAAAKVAAKVAGVKVIATKTAVFGDGGGNWGTGLDGNNFSIHDNCTALPNQDPTYPHAKSVCIGHHEPDGSCTGVYWGDD